MLIVLREYALSFRSSAWSPCTDIAVSKNENSSSAASARFPITNGRTWPCRPSTPRWHPSQSELMIPIGVVTCPTAAEVVSLSYTIRTISYGATFEAAFDTVSLSVEESPITWTVAVGRIPMRREARSTKDHPPLGLEFCESTSKIRRPLRHFAMRTRILVLWRSLSRTRSTTPHPKVSLSQVM